MFKQRVYPPEGCTDLEHWVFLSCKTCSMTNTISVQCCSPPCGLGAKVLDTPQNTILHFTLRRIFTVSCQTFIQSPQGHCRWFARAYENYKFFALCSGCFFFLEPDNQTLRLQELRMLTLCSTVTVQSLTSVLYWEIFQVWLV